MLNIVPTRRELLAWMLVFALVITVITIVDPGRALGESAEPTAEKEIGGEGGPAVEGHVYSFGPNTPVVMIATGENFPDALAAAAAGGAFLGPVLMVRQNSVPASVITELERLHPEFIYIAGGSDVVSDGVKATLEGLSFSPTVTRLQGPTRYETATEVSQALFPTSGWHTLVATASGALFPHVDDTDSIVMSIPDFEVPADGILVLNAGFDLYGGPDDLVECWININGAEVLGTHRDIELNGVGGDNSEEDCETSGSKFVTGPGVYDIDLMLNADQTVLHEVWGGSLTVLWVRNESAG